LTAVDSRHLQGVVTFPSFHAIMALLTAYALHDIRILSPFAWLWSGLVVLSTIPIGGHYAVDLLAGGVVWGILTMAFRMRPAPSRPPSAAIKRMN
jgi:membrane-associated phospholipid phosphatase